MSETHSCAACVYLLRQTESWEMPHISWWECAIRRTVDNDPRFPFKRTTCEQWTPAKRCEAALRVLQARGIYTNAMTASEYAARSKEQK